MVKEINIPAPPKRPHKPRLTPILRNLKVGKGALLNEQELHAFKGFARRSGWEITQAKVSSNHWHVWRVK